MDHNTSPHDAHSPATGAFEADGHDPSLEPATPTSPLSLALAAPPAGPEGFNSNQDPADQPDSVALGLSSSSSSSSDSCLTNKQQQQQRQQPLPTGENGLRLSKRNAGGGVAKGYKNARIYIGVRFPREAALDVESLSREWHISKSEVIIRLLAKSLADHGMIIEAQKQVQMVERAREALTDLQERVAEKDAKNKELQRALEKAQEELRQSQGIIERSAVATAAKAGLGKKEQTAYDNAVATFRRSPALTERLAAWVDAGTDLKKLAVLQDLPNALMIPLRRIHGQDLAATLQAIRGVPV